ncbi:Endonuclease/exonuclease/phosphatase [Cinara cedri]|uniref:Endonuclease/exonuclease/phosphatase n=1 Tax=Cinara cedri TaxID=506608 RepID=A0A5E4NCS7_9HEMI|nr:Endonuclease/exonuclease/phosphatase [Cinara cedri]
MTNRTTTLEGEMRWNETSVNSLHHMHMGVLPKCARKKYRKIKMSGDEKNELTVTAIYCPPQGGADETRFNSFFQMLGDRFIAGDDYNAKHSHWGSRLITPKGRALLKVANRKSPICFVIKGISSNYVEAEGLIELTSDHIPMLLSLSSNVIMKKRKHFLTNKHTNWDLFRITFEKSIYLAVRLKSSTDIEFSVKKLTDNIVKAAKTSTPKAHKGNDRQFTYPKEIRDIVQQKWRARRI